MATCQCRRRGIGCATPGRWSCRNGGQGPTRARQLQVGLPSCQCYLAGCFGAFHGTAVVWCGALLLREWRCSQVRMQRAPGGPHPPRPVTSTLAAAAGYVPAVLLADQAARPLSQARSRKTSGDTLLEGHATSTCCAAARRIELGGRQASDPVPSSCASPGSHARITLTQQPRARRRGRLDIRIVGLNSRLSHSVIYQSIKNRSH